MEASQAHALYSRLPFVAPLDGEGYPRSATLTKMRKEYEEMEAKKRSTHDGVLQVLGEKDLAAIGGEWEDVKTDG